MTAFGKATPLHRAAYAGHEPLVALLYVTTPVLLLL